MAPDSSSNNASADSPASKLSGPGFAGLDPKLFRGLLLPFLGDDISSSDTSCAPFTATLWTAFPFPVAFGFGVPVLFTGPSKDFLGLPLARFAAAGLESAASFRGTVVVLVRSAKRLEGESTIALSGSASTVTRIRQGLTAPCDMALDFLGEEIVLCGAGGVLR